MKCFAYLIFVRNTKLLFRWLSRIKVVADFVKSMPVILTFLEQKANESDSIAKVHTYVMFMY